MSRKKMGGERGGGEGEGGGREREREKEKGHYISSIGRFPTN